MWSTLRNQVRAFARPRHGLLAVLGLALVATLSWNGCSEDAAPISAPESAAPIAQLQINGYDQLPPEAQAKVDLVVGVIDDITSEQPDRIAAGFNRLDTIEPGLYAETMAAQPAKAGTGFASGCAARKCGKKIKALRPRDAFRSHRPAA